MPTYHSDTKCNVWLEKTTPRYYVHVHSEYLNIHNVQGTYSTNSKRWGRKSGYWSRGPCEWWEKGVKNWYEMDVRVHPILEPRELIWGTCTVYSHRWLLQETMRKISISRTQLSMPCAVICSTASYVHGLLFAMTEVLHLLSARITLHVRELYLCFIKKLDDTDKWYNVHEIAKWKCNGRESGKYYIWWDKHYDHKIGWKHQRGKSTLWSS